MLFLLEPHILSGYKLFGSADTATRASTDLVVKLNTPTMAVQSDNKHMSIVTLPANAVVVIVDGDIYGSGFVKIRYTDQTLAMYAKGPSGSDGPGYQRSDDVRRC
jgi:hypothetical protein